MSELSAYNAARAYPDHPGIRFQGKATPAAAVDRVWTERHAKNRNDPQRPDGATITNRATYYTHGEAHPKYPHAFVVDAYITSSDNKTDNWVVIYKVDMRAYCAAAGLSWPTVMAKDGTSKSDAWGEGSSVIEWRFDVVNPDLYTKPAFGQAHPLFPTAYFITETNTRNGVEARITRTYRKFPELVDWYLDPETNDLIKVIRQIVPTTLAPGIPARGISVSQTALGTGFSWRTTRMIANGNLPTAYTARRLFRYGFPRLLTDVRTIVDASGDIRFWPIYRSAFSKMVTARFVVDFHRTDPPSSQLFQPMLGDFNYPGALFNFNTLGVLNDQRLIKKKVGSAVESIIIPPSSPTYSAYRGMIGQEQLVAAPVTQWRFGLLRRQRVYVRIE